jgi:small ligand-binding sensory domain FIST
MGPGRQVTAGDECTAGSFLAAAGAGETWHGACADCLSNLGAPPARANLGIVYVDKSLVHALDLIAARLREATGIETWVGSGGSGVSARERRGLCEGSIAVLAGALPAGGFRPFDGLADIDGAPGADGRHGGLAIVHGEPRQAAMPSMVAELARSTGAFLVGGLTSAVGDGGMQLAGRPTEGGLSGVMMSAAIPMLAGLSQGCTPIGPVRRVTGIDGSWITTLDDRPALDCLKADVGPVLARSPERMRGFILAARPEGSLERSDYLVRDLGEVDELHGLVMVGDDLRRGDPLCFVKRDPEGARADLRRLAGDLRRRAEGRPIRGALYHSCIGRGPHLFGTHQAELAIIEQELGPLPLSAARTNGEVFKDRLYGYSAVLTLFLGEAAA